MAHIVAAEFKEFAAAEAARDALRGEGFAGSQLTIFYLSAPGLSSPEPPTMCTAGVVVAVHVPTPPERERATSICWHHGAEYIDVAEGAWRDGTWQDFDPVSIPRWHKAPSA
jgi:hypothetical protein